MFFRFFPLNFFFKLLFILNFFPLFKFKLMRVFCLGLHIFQETRLIAVSFQFKMREKLEGKKE